MKQTVKFEIDSDLLEAAHRLNIDLNEVVVQAVRAKVEHTELIQVDDFRPGEPSSNKVEVNLEDPVAKSGESAKPQVSDEEVMATFSASLAKYDSVYEHLAK